MKLTGRKSTTISISNAKGRAAGQVRVRRSTVLWKPKNAKGATPWFGVPLSDFEKLMTKHGTKMAK